MKIQELKQFIIEATQFGYANPEKAQITKEKDHSKTIHYKSGDWYMNDNFFGGEPYGGREVIFHKNKPVFIMVYYGWVNVGVKNVDAVYKFLQSALKMAPKDYPYRGPKELIDKNLLYKNVWEGELDNFTGQEEIFEDGKQVYLAKYMGGLVDRRESTEI